MDHLILRQNQSHRILQGETLDTLLAYIEENSEMEDDLKRFSNYDLLDRCLMWEGIHGYTDTILKWINDIYGIDLNRL